MVLWWLSVLVGALAALAGALGTMQHRRDDPDEVTRHPTRQRILRHLEQAPGTSITGLCRHLDIGWGSAQHHLYFMRQAKLIQSRKSGRSNRFFLKSTPPERVARLALLRRGRVLEVARAVVDRPGIGQQALTQALSMSRKVFRPYADLLKEHGLLKEIKRSNACLYEPTPELTEILSDHDGLEAPTESGVHGPRPRRSDDGRGPPRPPQ